MGYRQFGLTELTAVIRLNDCQNAAFQGAIVRCPKQLHQFKCLMVLSGVPLVYFKAFITKEIGLNHYQEVLTAG